MKIIKQDGQEQNFNPNKILTRIKRASKKLKINSDILAQKVIPQVIDGMTTNDIDNIIITEAINSAYKHPDYSYLASSIEIDAMHKNIDETKFPTLTLNYKNDYNFDYLALATFKKSYRNGDELPQEFYARIATTLESDSNKQQELYDMLSNKQINFATPINVSAGVNGENNFISCDISILESDSLEGIFSTLEENAKSSKNGAGVGMYLGNLRSAKSVVGKHGGKAAGVVRFADIAQATARFFNQKGRRPGSFALYLPTWHKDIISHCELRLNEGDEKLRTRDIFTGVMVDDIFMECLLKDKTYYMFCPHDIEIAGLKALHDCSIDEFREVYNKAVELGLGEEIKPREIWNKILMSQASTGLPYIVFTHNVSRKNMQEHFGEIKSSNLCVNPDTLVLTREGHIKISELENTIVDVWNGNEWSTTTVVKTATNVKQMCKVTTDSGMTLTCTPEHHWYLHSGLNEQTKVSTNELQIGDTLLKHNLPIIEGATDLKYAYTKGFYCCDEINPDEELIIDYQVDNNVAVLEQPKSKIDKLSLNINTDKMFIPSNEYTINSRLKWFAGLLDAYGTVSNNNGSQEIQLVNTNEPFLIEIQRMLQTIGVASTIKAMSNLSANNDTDYKDTFVLLLNGNSVYELLELGINFAHLVVEKNKLNRECNRYVKIASIEYLDTNTDTFCFTESKRGMGVFNGILTGQCSETLLYADENETGQCALGSIPLHTCTDIRKAAKTLSYYINVVIDINEYPTEKAKNGGLNQRTIGIGVAGLAEYLYSRNLSFEMTEAKTEFKKIMREIYLGAVEGSQDYYAATGKTFKDYDKSLYAQGIFNPQKWGVYETEIDMSKPVSNSLFVALMPTGTSSNLLNCTEAFEVPQGVIYKRKLDKGEFVVIQKNLVEKLEEVNMWNDDMAKRIVAHGGTIQDIEEIPADIRIMFKTAYEVSQKDRIEMINEAFPYIDQSTSLNLYYQSAEFTKMSSALIHGWKIGNKTGAYYTRVKKKEAVDTRDLFDRKEKLPQKPDDSQFECFGCSA